MAFATPDVGELLLLRYMLNNITPDNARLHLFANNITPSENDVLGTYTEVSAAGYGTISLTGSQWTFSTSGGTTAATFATCNFTFTTAATVYGWYMTNNGSSSLIMSESFSTGPVIMPNTGGTLPIDPVIILE